MSPLQLALLLGTAWSFLHFWLVPLTKERWLAVNFYTKLQRTSVLVVLEKTRDLTGIGAATFVLVAVVVQVCGWIGESAYNWPKIMIDAAAHVHAFAKSVSEGYGTALTILGLVGAAVALWWHARNAKRRVTEVWMERAAAVFQNICETGSVPDSVSQDPELVERTQAIESASAVIATLKELDASDEQTLATAQKDLADAIMILSIAIAGKEIDFPEAASIARSSDSAASPSTWGRICAAISSKKFAEDLGIVRKPLSRLITALLFVSLIGWSAEPMANSLKLGLNNMRVNAVQREAQRDLEKALSQLPPPAEADGDVAASPETVRLASQYLARGIMHAALRSEPLLSKPDLRNVEERSTIIRAALTEQTVDSLTPDAALQKAAIEAITEDASNTISKAEANIQTSVEPILDKLSKEHPDSFKRLLTRLEARYSAPMSAIDAQGKLTEKIIEDAFGLLDAKPGDELGKQAQKITKDVGKKAVQTWVDTLTKDFVARSLRDTALPEVTRALLFEASKPTRTVLASIQMVGSDVWAPSHATTKEMIMAEKVASLARSVAPQREVVAGYDDLFPAGGGGGGSPSSHGRPTGSFAKARAVSFRLASSSFRARGVIIGREFEGTPLDATDIRWTLEAAPPSGGTTRIAVELRVADAPSQDATWRPAGTYDAGVLNQAIRYAADRRVVATTIIGGDGRLLRRQTALHPALTDTPLGCRIIETDRLVDTFSVGKVDAALQTLADDRDNMQLWISLVGFTENAAHGGSCASGQLNKEILENGITGLSFSPVLRSEIDAFLAQQMTTPEGSDKLIRQVDHCAARPATDWSDCLCKASEQAFPSRYWFPEDHTSQVRERAVRLTSDLAWLRPSGDHTAALEFVTHTTFAIRDRATGKPDESTATTMLFPATELADLQREVIRRLPDFVAEGMREPYYDAFMRPIEEFVLGQRLARAALDGKLGEDFPLAKLIALERDTRRYVPSQLTLRWEAIDPVLFAGLLKNTQSPTTDVYLNTLQDRIERDKFRKPLCDAASR